WPERSPAPCSGPPYAVPLPSGGRTSESGCSKSISLTRRRPCKRRRPSGRRWASSRRRRGNVMWLPGPKHTSESVARELADGLERGTIALGPPDLWGGILGDEEGLPAA